MNQLETNSDFAEIKEYRPPEAAAVHVSHEHLSLMLTYKNNNPHRANIWSQKNRSAREKDARVPLPPLLLLLEV